MRLAKGSLLQLRLKLGRRGETVLESTQAPLDPARARELWQEVADFAQRQALADAADWPPLEPMPVVLPPELGMLARATSRDLAGGAVVDV